MLTNHFESHWTYIFWRARREEFTEVHNGITLSRANHFFMTIVFIFFLNFRKKNIVKIQNFIFTQCSQHGSISRSCLGPRNGMRYISKCHWFLFNCFYFILWFFSGKKFFVTNSEVPKIKSKIKISSIDTG